MTTTAPHANAARTFYTSSGMMHLLVEVIETIENGYVPDRARYVLVKARNACGRTYTGTATIGAGDLDSVTCPKCRAAVDLMVAAAAKLDALPTDEPADEVDALIAEVSEPAAVEVLSTGGELRQTEHGARYLTADEVAAERTAVEPAERIAAEVAASDVPAYLRPALDAYGAALDAHGQTYGASPACECGRPFRTRQGVGLHIAAEHKRAEREYTAAAAEAGRAHRLAMSLRARRPEGTTARERLAARHGMTVAQVAATTDEVLDGTPATDALDEQPRPLDAGEIATRTGTSWVVYCPRHRHYLVRASSNGTTWADDQAEARRYTAKREAGQVAERATWLDHNPVPWAVADDTTAEL